MSSSNFHLIHVSKYRVIISYDTSCCSFFVGLLFSYNSVNSVAHSRAQWREVVGSLYVRVPVWVLLEHRIFFDDKLLNTVPIRSVIVN